MFFLKWHTSIEIAQVSISRYWHQPESYPSPWLHTLPIAHTSLKKKIYIYKWLHNLSLINWWVSFWYDNKTSPTSRQSSSQKHFFPLSYFFKLFQLFPWNHFNATLERKGKWKAVVFCWAHPALQDFVNRWGLTFQGCLCGQQLPATAQLWRTRTLSESSCVQQHLRQVTQSITVITTRQMSNLTAGAGKRNFPSHWEITPSSSLTHLLFCKTQQRISAKGAEKPL